MEITPTKLRIATNGLTFRIQGQFKREGLPLLHKVLKTQRRFGFIVDAELCDEPVPGAGPNIQLYWEDLNKNLSAQPKPYFDHFLNQNSAYTQLYQEYRFAEPIIEFQTKKAATAFIVAKLGDTGLAMLTDSEWRPA